MKDISFGQVYPVESPIHRLDARAKLIITISYIVTIFFVDTFVVYGVVAVALLGVILLSRVPLRKVLSSVKVIFFLVVFTFVFTLLFNRGMGPEAEKAAYGYYIEFGPFVICGSGLINAGRLACRLFLLVLGPSLLTFTTTPMDLTAAIEHLLSPLKLLRLPIHELAMMMSLTLRLIPTIMEETEKIMNAQKARGACFDHGNIFRRAAALLPVLIPMFICSLKRAYELADAIDSRCYHGAKGRTKMKVMKYRVPDILAYLFSAALLFAVLVFAYNWWNWSWVAEFAVI